MKLIKLIILLLVGSFTVSTATGQANAYINILSQNGGVVTIGGNVFIEVTVGNSGPIDDIPAGKIIAQVSVPGAIVSIPTTGHVLPSGWTIISNSGTSIQVCNSGDIIPVFDERTILINLRGDAVGGPSTIIGQLDFRNNCTAPGSLNGDDNSDNSSTTTIQVIPSCPLTVTASTGTINCNGGSTTLTAIASGTPGPYEYKLNNGTYQSGNTFPVNAAGSPYIVTARVASTPTCTATSSPVTVTEPPPVPAPIVNTIVQPTCTVATGSVDLSGLPATGTWTLTRNPGGVTTTGTGTTATISGLAAGTYTFTVTNATGCTSVASANVVINTQPVTPTAPVVGTITQPTCAVATGTVVLNGLPATGTWTLTRNPGGVTTTGTGTSTTISGLATGTYTFTVTNSDGCTSSSSANVVINTQPVTPTAPVAGTIMQPTCTVATGDLVLNGLPATGTWTLTRNPGGVTTTGTGTSTTISGLASGTYTFTVTNSDGCTSAASANVVINVQPVTPAAPTVGTITQPTCTDLSGSVELNGLPSGIWTINPGAIAGNTSTITISGLAPGTFNYTVTNAVGCTSSPSANVVINNLPAGPPTPTVSVTHPTCTVATGTITITSSITGLTFSLDGAAYQSYPGGIISTVAVGLHTLTAKDAPGCISTVTNITVNAQPPTPAAPTINVIQPTCTVATGTILITSSTSGLTFDFNGAGYAGYPVGGYTPLTPGTYTLSAQNTSGCISPVINITVNAQPPTPSTPVVGTITQPTCAVSSGSVVLSGLPAGNWIINPGNVAGNTSTTTVIGLTSGTYNFTVTNSAGCTSIATSNVVINGVPGAPSAPMVNVIQPTCTLATGTMIITSSTTGFLFSLDGILPYLPYTGPYTGITAGPHSLIAQDLAFCLSPVVNITVNAQPPTPTTPVAGTITQPTCTVATGSVVLNGLPTTGTWTLTRNPGGITTTGTGTSTTISGLAAGAYTFIVTNSDGCTSSLSSNVNINAQPSTPAAPVAGTITHPTCTVATGDVVINGLPSTGTWTLTRNPGGATTTGTGTSTTISGLVAATYTFTVTNAEGCTSVASANVVINTQPVTPSAPVAGTITQPTCTVATGSVIINGLPATGTWTLTRNPGGITTTGTGTSTTISGLVAATYTFTVTNAEGCTSVASVNVVINTQPVTPTAPLAGTITQPTCTVATGGIVLNGLPLTGTWTLTRNPGGITTTGTGPSTTISGLVAGTYTFTVTNSDGCTSLASTNVVINAQPVTPTAPVAGTITQPTCAVATGGVVLNGLPATGTWTLTRNPGGVTTTGTGTSTTISGLVAGTYIFTVTNSDGCTSLASANVVINAQPLPPTASATAGTIACFGATTTLTVTASGGTAPYQYSINGGTTYQIGNTFTVGAGTYIITVQGFNTCIVTTTPITITQPTSVMGSASAGTIICNGGTTTLTVSASGGTPPYQYSLNGGAFQLANTFIVGAGTQNVNVRDANLCTSTATSVIITQPAAITATAAQAAPIPCNGGITSLTVAASGGTAPYQYSLNGGAYQSGNSFSVNAGIYTVTVRDANLCTKNTAPLTITQPSTLTASSTAPRITNCGGTTQVTVSASGGRTPYNGVGSFNRGPGTWNFQVTDASGCTTTATVTIEAPGCMNLKVFPNPASNSININHSVAESGSIMQVFSINGGLLISKPVPQNTFLTTVDVSILAAGPYILVYLNGGEKRAIQFEKIN